MRFRVDDPAPQVRAILAECRLGPDPGYIGELKRLFENRGYRRMYYRRDGLQLDQLGERMLDRGLVTERPTPDELLCYLDDLLRPEERRRGRRPRQPSTLQKGRREGRDCACTNAPADKRREGRGALF